MSADAPQPPPMASESPASSSSPSVSTSEPVVRTKSGSVSKMRSHRGNVPTLPQTKFCHLCPAKFTRTTHLNRHLKTHSNERLHECERCHAQFTRSDLLTRHKRTCCDSASNRSRRKSCQSCADSKVKCDLQRPCSKCKARGRECVYSHASGPAAHNSPDGDDSPQNDHTSPDGQTASPSSSSQAVSSPDTGPSPQSKTGAPKTPATSSLTAAVDFLSDLSAMSPFVPISTSVALTSTSAGPTAGPSTLRNPMVTPHSSAGVSTSLVTLESYDSNPLMIPHREQTAEEKAYLTELFSSPMYDNLFSDLFTSSFSKNPMVPGQHFQQDPTSIITERFEASGIDQAMLNAFFDTPAQLAMYSVENPTNVPPLPAESIPEAELAAPPQEVALVKESPNIAEMYEYISTFFTTYTYHMPVIHLPTFLSESRHLLLVKATKASGAMYYSTPTAANYIEYVLDHVRDEIIAELSHTQDYDIIIQLTLASILIQTIGMFHKDPEQRTKSNVYHGMIVMMLRMSGFVDKTRDWRYEDINFADPDAVHKAWREWAKYETAKRAIWVCFLHDCCHAIFFNLSPTFHTEQFTLGLPCEDALWSAKNSQEWAAVLQQPSAYGSIQVRLCGHYLKALYYYMVQDNPNGETRQFVVSPFAHFVLIHAMMRKLFEMYLRDRLPFHQLGGSSGDAGAGGGGAAPRPKLNPHFVDKDRVFHIQILLHCWLQSWLSSPDTPRDVPESQQRFLFNALPFYWFTQVGLVAYQEGLPPFDNEGVYITSHEAKFHLMKKWEKHIRKFLERGEEAPTMFWDEVMKSRTESWQAETGFEYSHLLGFFHLSPSVSSR